MRSICNSLVIIQAPADIPYALDIIEKSLKSLLKINTQK